MILADKITDLRKKNGCHKKSLQISLEFHVRRFRNGRVLHLFRIWIRSFPFLFAFFSAAAISSAYSSLIHSLIASHMFLPPQIDAYLLS